MEKKKQASHCSITDLGLRQSLNQLYNNHKMAKLVLFSNAIICLLGMVSDPKSCLRVALALAIREVLPRVAERSQKAGIGVDRLDEVPPASPVSQVQ